MEDFTVPHICRELKYEWFKQSDIDRFCSHIITPNWQDNPDICWETNYAKNIQGYSIFWLNGKNQRCHRIAYCFANQCDIPIDKLVMHLCNNPSCVNPKHLKLGTNKENMEYMVEHNRCRKGNIHPKSKITDIIIYEILSRILNCEFETCEQIGKEYDLSGLLIRRILSGITWKDITSKFCQENNISLSDLKLLGTQIHTKLTDDDVREIRSYPNSMSHYAIGKIYGFPPATIRDIRLRKTRKNVK